MRTETKAGVRKHGWLGIVLLLTACDPLGGYGGLSEQLHAFYRAEQAGAWDKVYALRVPEYRWGVSREYFVSAMREDAQGWELLDFEILDAEDAAGRVRVTLRFTYRITDARPTWRSLADADGQLVVEDVSEWVLKEGEWFCVDAGVRRHLPMSDALD